MPELICLDFDGTMVDSMPLLEEIAVSVMRVYFDISESKARKEYRLTTGLPFVQQIELVFPSHSLKLRTKAVEEYEMLKQKSLMLAPLHPETRTVLRALKKGHYKIAISSSSKQHEIWEYLAKNSLLEYLNQVLGYRQGFEKGKEHFDYLIRNEKLSREKIWFIGDSVNDMLRAYKADVFFIGKTGSMFGPEDFRLQNKRGKTVQMATINTLKGLLSLLKNLP